jgi:hypothetical protein
VELIKGSLIGLFRTSIIKHLTLRLCLSLEGAMPLRYARFLDYATDLGILEREGGPVAFSTSDTPISLCRSPWSSSMIKIVHNRKCAAEFIAVHKYDQKLNKYVGISFASDGEYYDFFF